MTLTGTSTFNGSTTISAGKLVINGSSANSELTIGNGGTLGGIGAVGSGSADEVALERLNNFLNMAA
jgi:autotransporter-associated beta strand protein